MVIRLDLGPVTILLPRSNLFLTPKAARLLRTHPIRRAIFPLKAPGVHVVRERTIPGSLSSPKKYPLAGNVAKKGKLINFIS